MAELPTFNLSRRTLLAATAVALRPDLALAGCSPPDVLFVCPVGTVKSVIARETLKRRAAEAGVPVRVRSRGIDVQNHVSPALAQRLKADRIDPEAEPAQKLAAADLAPGQIVVAFDAAAHDPRLAGARVWEVPSWNDDYSHAKAALSDHITALLAELRERGRQPCDGSRP